MGKNGVETSKKESLVIERATKVAGGTVPSELHCFHNVIDSLVLSTDDNSDPSAVREV